MAWLEYRKSDGYVVAIYDTEPITIPDGYGKVQGENFKAGDEFEYHITVLRDKDGNPTGQFAWVRQAPPATYLLQQLADKDNQIKELQQVVADLETAIAALLGGAM